MSKFDNYGGASYDPAFDEVDDFEDGVNLEEIYERAEDEEKSKKESSFFKGS